jgi:hypothetical protein
MYDRTSRWIVIGLLAVSVSPVAVAQQSPPPPPPTTPAHSAPRPEDFEPGVNTSAPAPASTSPSAVTPQSASPLPSATASGHSDTPPVAPKVGKPPASTRSATGAKSPANGPTGTPATGSNSGTKGKEDRLQLDTTEITGNQELPKVLYIVPWKRADLGDLLGKPANSLLDEVLQPVDRDVFKRENRYYDALKPDASGGADKAAGAAGQGSGDKR